MPGRTAPAPRPSGTTAADAPRSRTAGRPGTGPATRGQRPRVAFGGRGRDRRPGSRRRGGPARTGSPPGRRGGSSYPARRSRAETTARWWANSSVRSSTSPFHTSEAVTASRKRLGAESTGTSWIRLRSSTVEAHAATTSFDVGADPGVLRLTGEVVIEQADDGMPGPVRLGEADDERLLITQHVRRHPGPGRDRPPDLAHPARAAGRSDDTGSDCRARSPSGGGSTAASDAATTKAFRSPRFSQRSRIASSNGGTSRPASLACNRAGSSAPRSWLARTSAATGSSAASTSCAPPSMMPSTGDASPDPSPTRSQMARPRPLRRRPPARRFPGPIPNGSADPTAHDDRVQILLGSDPGGRLPPAAHQNPAPQPLDRPIQSLTEAHTGTAVTPTPKGAWVTSPQPRRHPHERSG